MTPGTTRAVAGFPRPPALLPVPARVRILFAGRVVAETDAAWQVLETYHPPTYYLPAGGFAPGALSPTARRSFCEWKGVATYYTLSAGDRVARDVGWGYPEPSSAFAPIAGHVAVYVGPMDACLVGQEQVRPQPGGFYGGWITADLVGPFKGEPGTEGW